jgi:hypothetical protein
MDLKKIVQIQVDKLMSESEFKGWVNVKIDNDVKIRVERLMSALGFGHVTGRVREKIKILSNPMEWRLDGDTVHESVNKQISAIMILQFLNEIRVNFHAPSAGFLFEYFMAGIIPGDVIERNKPIDIEGHNGYGYQLKLYDWSIGYVDKIKEQEGERNPDFLLIGYKKDDDIHIYQITYDEFNELLNSPQNNKRDENKLSAGKFRSGAELLGVLKLGMVSEWSLSISKNLANHIKELWDTVSSLHYNVEGMLSGVDREGNKTTILDSAIEAEQNTKDIDKKISDVLGGFSELNEK